MAHHHRRRGVEPVDQQPALVVDRKRERAGGTAHAAGLQPGLGRPDQCREHLGIVLGLDEAELAGGVVVALEMRRLTWALMRPTGRSPRRASQ